MLEYRLCTKAAFILYCIYNGRISVSVLQESELELQCVALSCCKVIDASVTQLRYRLSTSYKYQPINQPTNQPTQERNQGVREVQRTINLPKGHFLPQGELKWGL